MNSKKIQSSEIKEDTKKEINEIRRTIQGIKREFNKDLESLKKGKTLEIKISLSEIKYTVESRSSRLEQVEDRILGLEDKVDIMRCISIHPKYIYNEQ
jgi:hypothetical protein